MSNCRHRDQVTLPDGTTVRAVTFLGSGPYERAAPPDFGLYLDEAWAPPWPYRRFDWPDFGVPADVGGLRTALSDLLDRARKGDDVEVGCLGGHGRTGTALACAAVSAGMPAAEAVAWVREAYCTHAVEGPRQEGFVITFGAAAA